MEIMVSEKVQFREGWSLVRGNYGEKGYRKSGHKMGSVIITVFPQGFHS